MKEEATIDEIISNMRSLTEENNFYKEYLNRLYSEGKDINPIKDCVVNTLTEINLKTKSFVIYGEPQSGKTAMMIALTHEILKLGHKIVIVLLNDSKRLLEQNLNRFEESKIMPSPRNAMDLHENGEKIEEGVEYILFCKKNARNLENLSKLLYKKKILILDDEADYATPNGKINKAERSKINQLVKNLVGVENYYIGVTATPARLDLNNTLNNDSEKWVHFAPHKEYIGKDEFFLEDGHYERFYVSHHEERDLEKAAIAFICNVAVINSVNKDDKNYCMLIHTSGRKSDHKSDKAIIDNLKKSILTRGNLKKTKKYYQIFQEHKNRHAILKEIPEDVILNYIDKKISSNRVIEINSDNTQDNDIGKPPALFSFYVGGNIISRGVTFNNLLSMYFTRDTKGIFQQDTFIQRARMFGARRSYLKYFQLWIPKELFRDWQHSFIYHYISLLDLKETGAAPIWTAGGRVVPTSSNSIDRKNIFTAKRERYSKKFNFVPFKEKIGEILASQNLTDHEKLINLEKLLPIKQDLKIIFKVIELLSDGNSLNIHFMGIRYIKKTTDYHDNLFRPQGVLGGGDTKKLKKDHAILFLVNTANDARLLYYYGADKIRFFQKKGD